MLSTSIVIFSALAAPLLVSARPIRYGRQAALNFGKCTDPSIIFAAGLDGRKPTEFSFLPNNLAEFPHGSALNPQIIMQSNCDTLVNNCGLTNADATVIACRAAQTKAAQFGKLGKAADSFNGDLGFTTDFAALDAAGAGAAVSTTAAAAASTTATAAASASTEVAAGGAATGTCDAAPVTVTVTATGGAAAATTTDVAATTTAAAAATTDVATPGGAAAGGKLDFGTCTDPSIIFAAGLDGRKPTEFSFLPNNLAEFAHGSALNPQIIMQSNCDTLVNKCGLTNADATVIACRAAQTKAAQFGKLGKAADSFNGDLGFTTNFAALDVAGAGAAAAATTTTAAAAAASTTAAATTGGATTGGKLNFGTCTDPSIIFAAGLDGRKPTEFSFLPNNLAEFAHGSALNPQIIMQSNCDTLVNKCGLTNADATVIACRAAQTKAAQFGKLGKAADSFNGDLGFTTNFAALDVATA